jgi:hypothetical protein
MLDVYPQIVFEARPNSTIGHDTSDYVRREPADRGEFARIFEDGDTAGRRSETSGCGPHGAAAAVAVGRAGPATPDPETRDDARPQIPPGAGLRGSRPSSPV